MGRRRQIVTFTRRQFLGTLGIGIIISGKRQLSLKNNATGCFFTISKGFVQSRRFENRLTGESFSLPPEEFILKFDDGSLISSGTMALRTGTVKKHLLVLIYSDDHGLEVRVIYNLAPEAHYTRKQISVRQTNKPERRLLIATLENWQGVKRGWDSMHADALTYGSHPVYCDNLWAGVEFVAAFNEFDSGGFKLVSRPGGIPISSEWIDLHSTVVGVSLKGKVRDSFLNYIDDIRVAPPRITACYNSWWTLPKVVKQKDNLSLIKELKAGMYDRHGEFFDIITTDMGWSNPRSIWEIDRSVLPQGFDDIRSIVEPAGGKLGIWMSPSEWYPPVCDYDWAEKNGYTVLRTDRDNLSGPRLALSLADTRYRTETKEQLVKLIRENNLFHIKYDGFRAIEYKPHHNLLAREDSVEALAEYSLELLKASKAANPDLVTEPTYMNSIYNYISPWIIKYSDTVWANAIDCVVGIGPAPVYRESHTNAREYMVFRSIDQIWLPQNALQYFDIIHVDDSEGFANHAAMAFGRGRFFISTYLNPKLMSDDDWRIYAGLLRWARGNSEILRNTVIVQSKVESGEPYIYGHWLENRGILAVRNPSNESCNFTLDLAKTGAPAALVDAICYTQYPYRRGIASGLTGNSLVQLTLAPWELTFLEIVTLAELKETVAVGARWYRNNDDSMSVVPDSESGDIQLFVPGKDKQVIPVVKREKDNVKGKLENIKTNKLTDNPHLLSKQRTFPVFPFRYPAEPTAGNISKLKEILWKDIKWNEALGIEFDIKCSLSIPPECTGKVLLLVEFPGRNPCPASCKAWIDDSPVSAEEKRSEEHIGYFHWKGELRQYESEWCWYICNVGTGSHNISFKGIAGHPDPGLGLWIWVDNDLTEQRQNIRQQCSYPAMPRYNDHIERQGVCLLKPKTKTV